MVTEPATYFLDVNVVLDLAFDYRPKSDVSKELLRLLRQRGNRVAISSSTLYTLAYFLDRDKISQEKIRDFLVWFLDQVQVVELVKDDFLIAIELMTSADLEDNFQLMAAHKAGATTFITSDKNLLTLTSPHLALDDPKDLLTRLINS